jgi:hypothetical protein
MFDRKFMMTLSSVEEGLLTGFIIIVVIIMVNIFINRNSLRFCSKNKKENVHNINVIYYNRIDNPDIVDKKEDQLNLL